MKLRTTIRADIEAFPSERFCSEYIFEKTPHVFQEDWKGYLEWKTQLSRLIEVDAHNIRIVGSAAAGVSLSPMKNLKEFDDSSDIDVAVLSNYHFDVGWRALRTLAPSRIASLPRKQRQAVRGHMLGHIFQGTITTDNILHLLPFSIPWMEALETMSKIEPTLGREINLRLYKDADALRNYQIEGLKQLRDTLLSVTEDSDNE